MAEAMVWKGLAHVPARPDAEFGGAGAYTNLMAFACDQEEAAGVVAGAMDEHGCELIDLELDPLDVTLEQNENAAEWRSIAGDLGPDRPVWCHGTFHIYEQGDDG